MSKRLTYEVSKLIANADGHTMNAMSREFRSELEDTGYMMLSPADLQCGPGWLKDKD
jgi:hypothetical protein